MMIKKPILISLLLFPLLLSAQNTDSSTSDYFIKGINLSIDLWEKNWTLPPKKTEVGQSTVFEFKKVNKKDSFPSFQIIVERLKIPTDLTPYSLSKQKSYKGLKNYKVEKVFTNSDGILKLDYAMGTKASYTDASGRKRIFYYIHAVKERYGLQVILEVPFDKFLKYEEEITAIIEGMEYK